MFKYNIFMRYYLGQTHTANLPKLIHKHGLITHLDIIFSYFKIRPLGTRRFVYK